MQDAGHPDIEGHVVRQGGRLAGVGEVGGGGDVGSIQEGPRRVPAKEGKGQNIGVEEGEGIG